MTRSHHVGSALARWLIEQALASTRIEGHLPSAEFLDDCNALVAGELTIEHVRMRSISRARVVEATAAPARSEND